MATELPASDVLCEAICYLSKLGSNLKTRTDNLMEKKIQKDKLNNTNSVHKAASKVLLICELSKKSLENVEKGVRNILSKIDSMQMSESDGGKSESTSVSENNTLLQQFKYCSWPLRICKTVPIKHYMSAKVKVQKMSLSMQDKYPVYSDCKLYRMRKKIRNKFVDQIEKDKDISESYNCIQSDSLLGNNTETSNNNNAEEPKQTAIESESLDPAFNDVQTVSMSSELIDTDKHPEIINKHVKIGEKLMDDHVNKYIRTSNRETKTSKHVISNTEEIKKSLMNESDSSDKEQEKHERYLKNSSDDNESNKLETYISIEESSKHNDNDQPPSKRIKLSDTATNKDNDAKITKVVLSFCEKQALKSDKTFDDNSSEEQIKPKIQCVNISKLLKPDIANIVKKPTKLKMSQTQSDKVHKAYSNKKIKEVLAFKAKKFAIRLQGLPNISKALLHKYKLKKVTHNGSVICEVDLIDEHKRTESENIKNKLLNDSDSDDVAVKTSSSSECKRVKFALLNESDSDDKDNYCKNDGKSKKLSNNKSIEKQSEINNSDEENDGLSVEDISKCNKQIKKHTDNISINNIKHSLLNESDVEIRDTDMDNSNNKNISLNEDIINRVETYESTESDLGLNNIDKCIIDIESVDSSKSNCNIGNNEKTSENNLYANSDGENPCTSDNQETNSQVNEKKTEKDNYNYSGDSDNNTELNSKGSKSIHDKVDSKIDDKRSEKEISPTKIKSSLLNSSDDSLSDTNKSMKKLRSKRIRDNIKSKKMLMVCTSSEDDEPSKSKFKKKKDIDSKIIEISQEIEDIKKLPIRNILSSSSEEDLLKSIKKKICFSSNSECSRSNKEKDDTDGSQSTVDKSQDQQSDSSSSKMVRSKSKPESSISHNSDTQDDKDVDRLTNLENLDNPRRRTNSTSPVNKKETDTTGKGEKMAKGPSLIGEELLNAESGSESLSGEECVVEDGEVSLMSMRIVDNGIDHLSKDDLLGDSDSSVSQNGKTSETIQDNSDEENVKSKRRKANTISSDSEVGGSRKKDRDVKLSDFDDSDASSDHTKRTKRTKKASESDASTSSTDTNKKKRRRIKPINDSDVSDSDEETEGRNKHGRKNIRKVMGKNQLEEATKKAAREEKERIARITERQKLYNNLEFDESGKPDEVVLEKVVLDFDPETKEPLIEVDRGLVKKLKPHQANGIKFMWNACFESVKRIKKDKGSGCILAHCMGLGKTLQVISLTHTLLTHSSLTGVNRVLVVCPLSTVLNWVSEFRMWLKHAESDYEVDVYELSKNKQNMERAVQLNYWVEGGGVCVLGYEMFRNLSADNNKKFKKKMLKSFQESLVDPGPDLVVCDEGHLLKNEKTSLSQSMNKVKTLRRIVLTGTPLQNNLKEYYCMVQFVKPNLLGKYNEYLNRFVNPITNGQYTDSTEHDIKIMKRRSHVLHKMLDGAVQRRDYGVLAPFLPPKHEYVLFITLSEVQIKLYQTYLDNYSRRPQQGKSSGFLFPDFQSLQRIWTHPLVLKYNSERYEIMQQKKKEREEDDSEGSLADFIDDSTSEEPTSSEESTDDSSDISDDSRKKSKKKKSSKKHKGKDKASTRRGTRANPVEHAEDNSVHSDVEEVKQENPTEWWIKLVTDDELDDMRNSHKLILLFDILRQCETIGDKLLVFSQSLYSLDLIEHFLGKIDEATQEARIDEKLGGHMGSWSPGVDYFRLDGSTSCENRSIWCKNFNKVDNPRARLFLISTRAGGLGINLTAANRVIIFDVSWNPSHDVQSIFRVYRFGQKKPCYVYRFLAMGTMEEKIYERQVTKQAISKRVIDEQQIDRHYAENDLTELYKFDPKPEEPRELPALPKDRLFAEMLREYEAQIYKYHEHDSLLENKEEETLTEEERKAAWEDFENEKNRPPPAPFPTMWPMHNGMMPNMLAQQQQVYAMLASMMGKDNVNENQLRDMYTLLYNTPGMFGGYDYGALQKMSNYKFGQPASMMNPMMAASMMNPAAGSGMGGTSGLQYEPPWQRQHQHQQQQQLRLQQLMQQQNAMGAKYYAGGLGSRDPVAMALQQQRAREIMLSGGGVAGGVAGMGGGVAVQGTGSRPRGRPPLRTHAAPTTTGPTDVVNLDSD